MDENAAGRQSPFSMVYPVSILNGTSASRNLGFKMDDLTVRNTSKRQRNNHLDLVDRISALPDFILGDILSFLPTKDAVATSILSKRWKSAWVMVRNLDFCHRSNGEEQNDMKFIEFVNRVFLLRDAGPLNKFGLHWVTRQPILSSHASSWINTAITRHLQELFLYTLIHNGKFEVPSCVFSCVSLRCLHLDSCCISLSTSFVLCLPRLKTLQLIGVEFESDEAFERLISGCPMLHDLQLLVQPGAFTYIISSTSVRRLFLYCMCDCILNLKLEASSLEYLKLGGYVPKIFVLKSLSSHVEVDFQNSLYGHQHPRADVCDSVVEAVSALDCAKTLTLSAVVMWALSHGTVKLSTKFNRLLKLKTDIRYSDWRSLQDLIQRSDNLQVLTINQLEKVRGVDPRDRLKWTSPAEVPRCLSKSLNKIVFEGCHGTVEDEHEMIRYMLTHGSVLEVMRITCGGKMNSSMFKSVQKIGEYPRKSPFCAVKCEGWTSNNNVEVCFTARRSAIDMKKISKFFL